VGIVPGGKIEVVRAAAGPGAVLVGVADVLAAARRGPDERPRGGLVRCQRDLVTSAAATVMESHCPEGKDISLLRIEPSAGTLYALTVEKNKPEYYVRLDGMTFRAHAD
jgi:hypothetical protein